MKWTDQLSATGASPDAEIICAALVFPAAYALAVAAGMREEYLWAEVDRTLWRVVAASQTACGTDGALAAAGARAAGPAAISRWMAATNAVPAIDALPAAVELVRSAWVRRTVRSRAVVWGHEATQPGDGLELAGRIHTETRALLEASVVGALDQPDLGEVRARIDAAIRREPVAWATPTGFSSVDRLLGGGFAGGRTYILAGRPGTGKTMLGIQCAEFAADVGRRVGYFSFEMSTDEITFRRISLRSSLGMHVVRDYPTESERQKIERALDEIADASFLIDDSPRTSASQIEARVRLASSPRR